MFHNTFVQIHPPAERFDGTEVVIARFNTATEFIPQLNEKSFHIACPNLGPILPGTYINGQGTYTEENIEPYRRIGRLFGKPYAGDLNDIIQNHLERTNGSCNLALAYIIICAGKENNSVARLLQKIDAALADKKITGDSRVSWLLARAFAAEIAVPPVPRVGRGLRYLNEALGTAESSRMQYRIFKEIVVRKMSLGKRDDAKSLITRTPSS